MSVEEGLLHAWLDVETHDVERSHRYLRQLGKRPSGERSVYEKASLLFASS